MKDNYSWLDSALDNIVVVNGQDYDAYAITETVDLAKQTIISQIEIEKLRARIETVKELFDNGYKEDGVFGVSNRQLNKLLADLTEKLKELE